MQYSKLKFDSPQSPQVTIWNYWLLNDLFWEFQRVKISILVFSKSSAAFELLLLWSNSKSKFLWNCKTLKWVDDDWWRSFITHWRNSHYFYQFRKGCKFDLDISKHSGKYYNVELLFWFWVFNFCNFMHRNLQS